MTRPPPGSTLFPYTTLFRSQLGIGLVEVLVADDGGQQFVVAVRSHGAAPDAERSEEHTSELQSRGHLVCRLLLEKKKRRVERDPFSRTRRGLTDRNVGGPTR